MQNLKGKRFAILATNGFEQSEFTSPKEAILSAQGEVDVISLSMEPIRGWTKGNWGEEFEVDRIVSDCSSEEYDGLVLPGGVLNPDRLRMDNNALKFIRGFFKNKSHKPVAAICHGPLSLIDAKVVAGKKLTSYPSIQHDLINAGASWVDEVVVVDDGLITSRSPKDLEAFNKEMLREFSINKDESFRRAS